MKLKKKIVAFMFIYLNKKNKLIYFDLKNINILMLIAICSHHKTTVY